MKRAVLAVAVVATSVISTSPRVLSTHASERINVLGGTPQGPIAERPRVSPPAIHYRRGLDFVPRIPPGATQVDLRVDLVPPDVAPTPRGISYHEYLTRQADLVALVEPTSVTGIIAPDRDWILSIVEANLIEPIKTSGTNTAGGSRLSYRVSGGSVVVGQTTVTASDNRSRRPTVGIQYLVFLQRDSQGDLYAMGPRGQYEVRDGTLWDLDSGSSHTAIHGSRLEEARTRAILAAPLQKVHATLGGAR